MLTEAGSVASRAGLVVSSGGLGFAIWHILQLRGETKAARKAEEKARLAMSRETARMTLTRVNERIEGLKELHRNGEWYRAKARYPEIRRMLIDIRIRHPEMYDVQRNAIQTVVRRIARMENEVEGSGARFPEELGQRFNRQLTESQLSVSEIESELQHPT